LKPLPHPDNLYMDAASGWLMLGDSVSARQELDRMTPESRLTPSALELAWASYASQADWQGAYQVAEVLIQVAPALPMGWIHRAYAARRMPGGGLARAWELLAPAAERFPKESMIPFNLACYAAQSQQPVEAWNWLLRAAEAEGDRSAIRKRALADPDLQALWPRIKAEFARKEPPP